MNKRLLSVLLICLFPFMGQAATESVRLQLKWKHQFQFAGFYMALEKGYYRDAGFDVEIREVEMGTRAVDQLASGQADYAVVDPGVLLARAEGAPVKVLASIFQHSPLALIVRKDSGIKDFSDLRGKRIMLVPGLNADIDAALGVSGIAAGEFIRQEISFDIRDLVSGKTDAFAGYVTDQPHQLELMGIAYNILHPKEQGIDFYGDVLVTSEKEVVEHPDKVEAFTRASIHGWQYALKHIDETIDVIQKKYNSQNFSSSQLYFEARKTKEMIESDIVPIGYMREQRWQDIADIYIAQGLLPKNFAASEAIYQPEEGLIAIVKEKRWQLVLTALLVLLFGLGLHSMSLRRAVRLRTVNLQQSEEQLRLALAAANQAWFDVNVQTGEVKVSPEYSSLIGYKPEEFETSLQNWMDHLHPDDHDAVLEVFQRCLASGESASMEYRRQTKSGGWVWMHSIGKVVEWDKAQKPLRMIGIHRDITERKKAEEALQESELRIRTIADFTYDWESFISPDGKLIWVNPAVEKHTGYSVTECMEMPDYPRSIIVEEDRDAFNKSLYQSLTKHSSLSDYTFRALHKNESIRWMEASWQSVYDNQGKFVGLRISVRDISDRKKAEEVLRQSREAHEEAQRIAHLGHWSLDLVTNKLFWSDEIFRIFEIDKNQFGASYDAFLNVIHPDDREYVDKTYSQSLETRKPYNIEHRLLMQNGSVKWVNERCRTEYAEDGKPLMSLGTVLDVTDRKQAEEALRESELSLRQAQATAHLGSWTQDMEGRITWSDELYHIYGVSPDTFTPNAESLGSLVHPDDWPRRQSWVDTCLKGGGVEPLEFRIIWRDGDLRYVRGLCELIRDANGKPNHLAGTTQDITEYKRLEDQFYQAQKMEALGTLVGGIAHDFNNILSGITGNLYLARRYAKGLPKAVDKLDTVEKLSLRASVLIKQLLAYARRDMVMMKPLQLAPYVEEVIKLLRSSLPENIELHVQACSDSLTINGDDTQLHQVLMNLVNNARDAVTGTKNPAITVELEMFATDELFISEHPYFKRGTYAHLSVKDNGCGIPDEHIEHLFEPFYTSKDIGKGTGLGLAMVFGAIKTHRGYVEVESVEGKGSTFHVYLPLIEAEAPESALPQQPDSVEGAGETILLADDDANVRETTIEVLKALGYRVLAAENGEQAVELFRENSETINLVLSDLVMPVMGGYESVQAMRQIQPDVRVIFATGYDSNGDAHLDDELVIRKPFVVEELSRLISQQLEK
ncbi:PAS domain-containing protein [Mariprofundus aestuarium]|uniref:PAS domain-containing protein n=1 Tax=Mariprofundus aestuarium TaxID=1921086 RepID=UPI0018E2527E|nr:PAS domain-containing protein [Mariprofundus aestuarium]